MTDLFLELSQIIGVRVTRDNYEMRIRQLSARGGFTLKHIEQINIFFVKYFDEQRAQISSLEKRISALEEKPVIADVISDGGRDPGFVISTGTSDLMPVANSLKCPECDFVAKAHIGLVSHKKLHAKKENVVQPTSN